MLDGFALLVRRDLRVALRRRGDVLNVLVFFIVAASLFALGVGPEPMLLRAMGAGVVWVAALLSAMLSLPRMFAADLADGTLEQLLVSPQSLIAIVCAKIASHWLVTGLPLTLVAPLIGLQYNLTANALGALIAGLLIGTPVLSLLGAAGAALTLGARGAGVLLGLLLLPLYVPILVFGAGAVLAVSNGLEAGTHLSLLGAFLAVSSLIGPLAACAALKIALD
jgi:heme exporter protein B